MIDQKIMGLRSEYVNRGSEALAYRLDSASFSALEELLAIYNPIGGPVKKVITYFGNAGGVPSNVGHSEYYDLDYILQRMTGLSSLDTGTRRTLFAGGKGFDLHSMFVSSLAETAERVLTSMTYFSRLEEHVFGSYAELSGDGAHCLSPKDMPLFSKEQYKLPDFLYEPFMEDSQLSWVEGKRLLSGQSVWVPAQLVELLYPLRPDETMIGYSVSGGLSSHVSFKDALFHGITELIERDAINLRWYCGIPPVRVTLDRQVRNSQLAKLVELIDKLPGKIDILYHSMDIPEVPVITVVEVDPWLNQYAYFAGGGADINAETALLKALNEFGQSERTIRLAIASPDRALSKAIVRMFGIGPDDPISKINVFFKVIAYYGYRQNIPKLDWYLKEGKDANFSSLPSTERSSLDERYDYLMEVLRKRKLDPIVFDFTPIQMKHMKLIKVFLPELTQAFIQSMPLLGHPRFTNARKLCGIGGGKLSYEQLVSDPLPYP